MEPEWKIYIPIENNHQCDKRLNKLTKISVVDSQPGRCDVVKLYGIAREIQTDTYTQTHTNRDTAHYIVVAWFLAYLPKSDDPVPVDVRL